jgi:transcriptional regulator with XRE-family HTH domain
MLEYAMEIKKFPDALRMSRKLKDWSQGHVAEEIGASQQTVAGWERGRSSPRPDAYAKLVELFGSDSLVAKHPPTDEDLMVAREVALPSYWRASAEKLTREDTDEVRQRMAQRVTRIGIFLQDARLATPEKYRDNFEKAVVRGFGARSRNYMADYLSEEVCAQIKHTSTPFGAQRAVHAGICHLLVLKALLQQQGRKAPETLLLFLVTSPEYLGHIISSSGWSMTTFESTMLGIDVVLTCAPETVAEAIERAETGIYPEDLQDEPAE